MLVITDKLTLRVCREGGLTCTRETEEDSGVLTVHVAVCRAVHGSDALQRQIVVHHWEHTLLHLTAIPCVDDYLLAACGVEGYASLWVKTQLLVVSNNSLWSVVNNEVWLEGLKLLSSRTDEHVCYKVSLPSYLNDEAYSHTGVLVGTAETIYYIEVLVWKLVLCNLLNLCPNLLRHWVVVVLIFIRCPPYSVLWVLVHYDVLVLRRTSGVDTSHYVDCAKLGLLTNLETFKSCLCLLLEQLLVRRIVSDYRCTGNAILCQI